MWMTYAELAERTGVELASAQRRAMRAKWSRRPGNDGRARVAVPLAALEASKKDKAPDTSPDMGMTAKQLMARLEAAEAALAAKALELAQVREDKARLTGELEGVKLAAEHLHEAASQARREATEAQRKALEAEAELALAKINLGDTREALAKLQGRGLLARLLNKAG